MSAPGPIRSAAGTKDNWATPQYIFDHWNERFHFDLDAAADASNAKCADYLDEEFNSLVNPWGENRRVWINPPFGNLLPWIRACIRESKERGNIIVALLPNNTDSLWYHEAFLTATEITFLKSRINFIDPATGKAGRGNTGGSIFVTWIPGFYDDGYPRSPSVRLLHLPRPKEAK
jgi:phage N-6-adenine-methyltransferase